MIKYILFISLFITHICFSFQFETKSFFVENNGQLIDQNLNQNNKVKYYLNNKNIKLLLEENAFSYQIHKMSNNNSYLINKIEFEFINPNPNLKVCAKNQTIENLYFYNIANPVKASTYEKIIYKNVWKDVDVIFYANTSNNTFKYDVKLGKKADIRDIKFRINGAETVDLNDDELIVKVGDIKLIEHIPLSIIDNGKNVKVDYSINDNIVSFNYNDKEFSQSLIIDPLLNFATYFGGIQDDTGLEICTDTSNNVIITGFTMSLQNIATSGVYQTELKGSADAFIAKFNSSGQRLWASYFGGSDYDTGHSIASFVSGELVMVGWTKSKSNIATSNAHQKFFSGGEFDSYIAKFSQNGQLLWSTYYGGSNDDYINDVTINGKNEIIIVGQTSSHINISTLGSYQEQLSGNFDAFVTKFNSDGNRIWGSYYGGTGLDVGMEIATDVFNNIVIIGYTQSRDNIARGNAWKSELWGSWDAFLAKFTNNGDILWATYFGGNDEDNGRGVDIDGYGNIYLTGNTLSNDSLATSGVHQDTISSEESDAFIAKFNKNGLLAWATYLGGGDIEIGNMDLINPWNQCMVSGNTASSSGIATNDAFQSVHSGFTDMFYAIFDSSANLVYGTYYGGENNDYGHGLALDKKNNIYFTGYTNSRFGISTPNAYQENLGGGNDAVLLRFNDFPTGDTIIVGNINANICVDNFIQIPYSAIGDFDTNNVFIAQLSNAQGSFLDFENIGSIKSTTSGTITAYIPKGLQTSNNYRIRVISTNPQIISSNEALYLSFYELPNVEISGELNTCRYDIYQYHTEDNSNYDYKWFTDSGQIIGSDSSNTVSILWDSVMTANLKLVVVNTVTGCKDSSQIQITVNPNIQVNEIFGEKVVCPNTEMIYYTTSNSFTINSWEIENGEILTDSTLDSIIVKWEEVSSGKLKLTQTSITSGCSDSTFIDVGINELPEPFIIGDTLVYARTISEYRTSPNSKYIYEWKIKFAHIIGDNTSSKILIKWGGVGSDTLTLIMTDKETGCSDSLILPISIRINPNELISGDTIVCAHTSLTYSYNDDNYYKKWIAEGGIITGPDTMDVVSVLWEFPGNAYLTLIRTNKESLKSDTIVLNVKILSLPTASIYGNNETCENITEVYYAVYNSDYQLLWEAVNGTILGKNDSDTVTVSWGEVSDDSSNSAKLLLYVTDLNTSCTSKIVYKIFQSKNPAIEIIGDSSVCSNKVNTYFLETENDEEISWSLYYGEVISYQNDTLLVIWDNHGIDTLKIIATNTSNCIDSISLPIVINPSPDKPFITQAGNSLISSAESGNQWFLDGGLIDGANKKVFTPVKSGNYTVQVTNESGCKSEMSEPIYFEINSVVDNTNFYSISPNPVKEFVLININSYFSNFKIKIKVFDVIGNIKKEFTLQHKDNTIKIDLSDLNEGIYFIVISVNNIKLINKIVKY